MGDSLARSNGQGSGSAGGSSDSLDAFLALNNNFSGVSAARTFAEDRAIRNAALNPNGLPTSSAAQIISDQPWTPTGGYGYAGDSAGITGWKPGPSAVSAGDYGGSMERVARAQLGAGASQRDINNYVGQLIEINGITNPRAISGDAQIALPGVNTPAATSGLGVYGRDIALGEQMKAVARTEQAAASAQAATNASGGFADGRDARDIRLSFGYQSMMSRGLSDLQPLPGSELRASNLSPRDTAVDWVRSVVGTDRAGNVIAGAVNGWLAGGEAVLKLPDTVAAIPSAVMRLAGSTASAATQLWNDPVRSVTNTMASSVDGLRTGFNQTVNGNGFPMGGAMFAMATMGVPLGRAERVVGTGLEREIIDFSRGEALKPGFYRADPRQLRFTQSDASPNFIDRVTGKPIGTIDSLVSDLQLGRVTADQVGSPLQVVMREGVPFSIDNRRLVAFNAAGVRDVPIQIMDINAPGVARQFIGRFDPIRGEGTQIVITPASGRAATQQLLYEQGLIRGVQLRGGN